MDKEPAFWRREPPRNLRGLVSGIYAYDEGGVAMRETVEPAGLDVPLIINFGSRFEIALGRAPTGSDRIGSFGAGLFAGPIVMNSDGGAQCIQVNFTPLGGRLFYGIPLEELAERMVGLDDLADAGIGDLSARLAELNSWESRLAMTERFVADRLAQATPPTSEICWAISQIEGQRGDLRMNWLCDELGWSRRRLAEQMRHEFGLTPKSIARIARFEAAEAMALAVPRPDWADIAAACGFADQAHLAREFSDLAGRPPTLFRAA